MSEDKKILAIETSGELCSVAISFSPEIYDERNILMKHISCCMKMSISIGDQGFTDGIVCLSPKQSHITLEIHTNTGKDSLPPN